MADTRARSLHRAASGGDQQAEARSLVERVRRGELAQRRLELAAVCGHGLACLALGRPTPSLPVGVDEHAEPLAAWYRELCDLATTPELVRFALIAAEETARHLPELDPDSRPVLEPLAYWLDLRTPDLRGSRARGVRVALNGSLHGPGREEGDGFTWWERPAALLLLKPHEQQDRGAGGWPFWLAMAIREAGMFRFGYGPGVESLTMEQADAAAEQMRAFAAGQLAAWALEAP